MIDSIDDLRLFVSIFERRSIVSAGRAAMLSAPAASKRLMAFEARLGRRLFHRSTRSLAPTSEGESFYVYAKAILDRVDETESVLSGKGDLVGQLRVTASATFADLYLGPILDVFMHRHPALLIDLDLTDRVVDLVAEGVDVAIRYGGLQDSGLVARRLLAGRQLICAAPSYLEKFGRPMHPGELVDHVGVVLGLNPRWTFRRNEETISARIRPSFRSSQGTMVRQMAVNGHGLALLADWHAEADIRSGALEAVLADWSLDPVAVHAVYASRDYLPAKVRLLIDHLARSFEGAEMTDR